MATTPAYHITYTTVTFFGSSDLAQALYKDGELGDIPGELGGIPGELGDIPGEVGDIPRGWLARMLSGIIWGILQRMGGL